MIPAIMMVIVGLFGLACLAFAIFSWAGAECVRSQSKDHLEHKS